ncbi:hypothetical protein [Caenispirillum bisanense]|uniref:Hopanoid-associated phosphorylase n=1 Tax=Caenispirillum bisanense TaxID=414052 RepID=A0A286G587_9PROT|nr:hypothetical protein [Caenispirillum bisanense]SOD90655.1 hopanoid-associated phosphorylase [Caenispirillum bisanense]
MGAVEGIGVVTGLQSEAAIVRRLGHRVACSGANLGRAEDLAEELIEEQGVIALVSFGLAGGLAPGMAPGTLLVPSAVMGEDDGFALPTDALWRTNLLRALPDALTGAILGLDRVVPGVAEKRDLFEQTAAVAVDTESLGVAEAAARRGLPFVALRAVCDPWDMSLPQAALVGVTPTGHVAVGRVLAAVLRHPAEAAGLARTARASRIAHAALFRGAAALAATLP